MDVFCDLMYGGGWMEIEREEVDRECDWALVSAIVLKMRDHRLTCFTPADRVQVASLDLGIPFLAVQTRALPPRSSFSRSLSRSNTANNSPRGFKIKERWLPSSHLESRSNGSKPLRSMDVPTLSGTYRGVRTLATRGSKDSFRPTIVRRK
jgi:hypothetical protein